MSPAARRAAIGIAAFLPALYATVFIVLIMPAVMRIVRDPSNADPEAVRAWLAVMAGAHILMMLLAMVVIIGFLVHLFRSKLDAGQKVIWALALVFGNVFIAPVYYYIYFVRAARDPAA